MRTLLLLTAVLLPQTLPAQHGTSLRFFGHGVRDIDRVKIRIDDPKTKLPGPPADVGATDFTIEFWMKAAAKENPARARSCGNNINWIYGNIILDRDRFNQDRKFGLSIAGGRVLWGMSGQGTGARTICSTTAVLDSRWHHVAVQRRRSDGRLWLFIDGAKQVEQDGPDGDVSYPDDGIPLNRCGGPCTNSDPFLVIAAEKHDAGSSFPSYAGLFDELRLSTVLRYTKKFTPPKAPFKPDAATAALYHFDEAGGSVVLDSSGAKGGPSHGVRMFGGNTQKGPLWSTDTPFKDSCISLTLAQQPVAGQGNAIKVLAPCNASGGYLCLCSHADRPGFAYGPHHVPLNPGIVFDLSLTVPVIFVNFSGKLDSQGRATTTLVLPKVATGFTLYMAGVTLDGKGFGGVGAVSTSLPLRIK